MRFGPSLARATRCPDARRRDPGVAAGHGSEADEPLGLDLRGGVHFLFEVDMATAIEQRLDAYSTDFNKSAA